MRGRVPAASIFAQGYVLYSTVPDHRNAVMVEKTPARSIDTASDFSSCVFRRCSWKLLGNMRNPSWPRGKLVRPSWDFIGHHRLSHLELVALSWIEVIPIYCHTYWFGPPHAHLMIICTEPCRTALSYTFSTLLPPSLHPAIYQPAGVCLPPTPSQNGVRRPGKGKS